MRCRCVVCGVRVAMVVWCVRVWVGGGWGLGGVVRWVMQLCVRVGPPAPG